MRRIVLLLILVGLSGSAWAQVGVDSDSTDVGAPGKYRLDPGVGVADPNTADVGRPYPYYYGPYGSPYYNGLYRPGVQAVPDANDPNYFPPEAAMGAKQAPAPARAPAKKAVPPPSLDQSNY